MARPKTGAIGRGRGGFFEKRSYYETRGFFFLKAADPSSSRSLEENAPTTVDEYRSSHC